MNDALHKYFTRHGRPLTLESDAPARLHTPGTAFMLISGKMEIFAQHFDGDTPKSARIHIYTALPGDVLYGAPTTFSGLELLGVGGQDCKIRTLDLPGSHAAAPLPATALLDSIEHFLVGLSHGLTRDIVPKPRLNKEITTPTSLALTQQTVAGPRHGVIWIRDVEGQSPLFLGQEEMPGLQAVNNTDVTQLFPLPAPCWLLGTGQATIQMVEKPETLTVDVLLNSLHTWCEFMLECLDMNTRMALADTWNMLRHKQAADEKLEAISACNLAQVLSPTAQEPPPPEEGSELYTVMCQVGNKLGIEFLRPAGVSAAAAGYGNETNTPASIADQSGIRYRAIALDTGWWKLDHGPLLAFDRQTGTPVAVCTDAKGKNVIKDASGKQWPLNKASADNLSDTGYTFFKPLPFTSLAPSALIQFAFKDTGKDIRRALFTGLAAGLLGLVLPLAAKTLFSQIIPAADIQQLAAVLYAVLGAVLAVVFLEVAGGLATLRTEARIEARVESALWDRLLRMPSHFFHQYTAGNIASRSTAIQRIRESLTTGSLVALAAGIFSLTNLLYIFIIAPTLGATVSILLLIQGLMNWALTRFRLKHLRLAAKVRSRLDGLTLQFLSGLHQLRIFGQENRAFSRWASIFSQQRSCQHKAFQTRNLLRSFNGGFTLLSLATVFALIGLSSPSIDPGSFIAFYVAFGAVQAGVLKLTTSLSQIVSVLPQIGRIRPILKHAPEDNNLKPAPGPLSGKVDICELSFSYGKDAPPALDNVTFSVTSGEFLAIVGPSGSGKSTLLQLITGLVNPSTGSISFDDLDLADLNARLVRRQMGVVLQGFGILPGTIRQTIAGDRFPTEEELWEAAEISQFADTIRAMEQGMDSTVWRNGSNLSGGQRQQLMIAKAVLHNPPILIMDEGTSALDNDNQAHIIQRLEALNSTRIVVAHRLSTIQNADRILVLDKGRIVESGNFQTLMDKGGLFHAMATRQIL